MRALPRFSVALLSLASSFALATACGEVVPVEKTGAGESDAAVAPTLCENNSECDDGLRCNGIESCNPGAPGANAEGCVLGQNMCADDEVCFEEGDEVCADRCSLDPDLDGDGFDAIACGGDDCDDDDMLANPAGSEVCDLNHVDEDCQPRTIGSTDDDGDNLVAASCCNTGADGELDCGVDCDDTKVNFGLGDWEHCGACGNSCKQRESCGSGSCKPARRVFVTSSTHNGALGGVAGADKACQDLAKAAKLEGVFKAFLVDGKNGLDRLEKATVPYVRLDGKMVAKNFTDLRDNTIDAPMLLDEQRVPQSGAAWTGLPAKVGIGNFNCNDWSFDEAGCGIKTTACGATGDITAVNTSWASDKNTACSAKLRLYCLEQ